MAELMMPTTAPTIAPTTHARVESINPEPLVIWNETQFAELLSPEEMMLEVASLQSAEQRSHSDAASVQTSKTFVASWTPTGSPTSSMSMIAPPLPPREIVFEKTKTKKNASAGTGWMPPSPQSPHRAPLRSEPKLLSQHSLLWSPSCDTTKLDSMNSLSSWELQMISLPSIDVAVPLTRELSVSRLPQTRAEEEPISLMHILLDHLQSNVEETRGNQRNPLARFVEARVATFLNNLEYLTGIPISGKRPLLKGAEDKEDEEGQIT
jgi:hypothetical protein